MASLLGWDRGPGNMYPQSAGASSQTQHPIALGTPPDLGGSWGAVPPMGQFFLAFSAVAQID